MTDIPSNIIHRQSASLCPACGASTLTVSTSAVVSYELTYDPKDHEFVVIGDNIGDSDWDLQSDASCPQCQWRGPLEACLQD